MKPITGKSEGKLVSYLKCHVEQLLQGSRKNLRKQFHAFSMTSPGQNPYFQTKNINICFCGPCINSYNQLQTDTDAHSHTDTHMIWSRPADYSTDFTCNWTDSRSQKLHLLISLKWVTDFPISIWKIISISHFHTDLIFNSVIIIL